LVAMFGLPTVCEVVHDGRDELLCSSQNQGQDPRIAD
jgi:hypothetical protein